MPQTHLGRETGELSLIGQIQQLLFGAIDVVFRAAYRHLVALALRAGELDGDAPAVLHDGVDELAARADQRVVELGGDGDLLRHDVFEFVLDLADFFARFLDVLFLAADRYDVVLVALVGEVDARARFLANFADVAAALAWKE